MHARICARWWSAIRASQSSRGLAARSSPSRTLSAYQDDYLKAAREQKWFRAFGATSQEEHRKIGRRLVDLAIRYAATPGQRTNGQSCSIEGREIGVHYGVSSAQAGLSTSETIEVFLYFRYPVVKALLDVIEKEGLPARRASRLFIGIDDFIDEVLVAMIRAHSAAIEASCGSNLTFGRFGHTANIPFLALPNLENVTGWNGSRAQNPLSALTAEHRTFGGSICFDLAVRSDADI